MLYSRDVSSTDHLHINAELQIKGKVNPITSNVDTEEEWRFSPTVSLTLFVDGGGLLTPYFDRLFLEITRYPLYNRRGGPKDHTWKGV